MHFGYERWNDSEIEIIFERDSDLIHKVCGGGKCWLELIKL